MKDGSPGDWNLVLLHHADCGMTDLAPDFLVSGLVYDVAAGRIEIVVPSTLLMVG